MKPITTNLLAGVLFACAALSAPLRAQAPQEECHTRTVPQTTTAWLRQLTYPKFDPANRVLVGVRFTANGEIRGQAQFESLDNRATTVNVVFSATLQLQRPDASILLQTFPTYSTSEAVTAYDGTLDFGGNSGRTLPNLVATPPAEVLNSTLPADLALFTGPAGAPGTIDLTGRATGASVATGPGNLVSSFSQTAGIAVQVCYLWLPDCNNNGIPDAQDIANGAPDRYGAPAGGPITCVPNGVPDACEVIIDCNLNQFPDVCDIAAGASDIYGKTSTGLDTCQPDGVPDECQRFTDCNDNDVPDVCDIAGGTPDLYGETAGGIDTCQPDGIPDVCQVFTDCNGNAVPDTCDIAGGTPDLYGETAGGIDTCQPDGIPDVCQVFTDCNGNAVPDTCDIAGGEPDLYGRTLCTPDGVPDACQDQPDCDDDGLPDRCEIAAGALDLYGAPVGGPITCAPNGVPDSCEAIVDCNNNGVPDSCDIAAGAPDLYGKPAPGQVTCAPDGIPDACQQVADCDRDGLPDRCEILGGARDVYGTGPNGRITCSPDRIPDICQPVPDCDKNGIPNVCEIASGAGDCNGNGLPDSCEPDCNADGTIDACEPDCNADGIPDDCQTLPDCNANGIPDPCELAGGAGDCDGDGLLDACEVDCDKNGVPDQCEIASAPYLDADLDGQLDSCTCVPRDRGAPGSLLVYPHFDNRAPAKTLYTVTNIDTQRTIDVHFVFLDAQNCLEANFTRRLTPRDTLSFLTSAMNPNMAEGWCFAYAQDPATGAAAKHDFLVGRMSRVDGVAQVDYDLNAVVFRAVAGPATDVDGDGLRDLDGVEYEEAPDEILIPRFFAQDEQFTSELILLALGGSGAFSNIVDLRIYNDNEEIFSLQTQFTCWSKTRLADLSPLFTRDYLSTRTNSDPNEVRHAPGLETGWMSLDGRVASSGSTRIVDPAIYAVLVESTPGRVIADLPWERCSQANGVLLPVGSTGQ